MNSAPSESDLTTRREARRQRRLARRSGSWVGGAILIGLGALLLMQQTGALAIGRWWALLIMIPAIAAFVAAWDEFRAAGSVLNGAVIGLLVGGLLLATVAIVFFLDLDWAWFGPALLLLAGVGLLIRAFAEKRSS